ncbi:kinase-like domain-containing protein [Syncephalis fuscata]|nr:kinase-like domain-containing protein [Syncephalis fuscata]
MISYSLNSLTKAASLLICTFLYTPYFSTALPRGAIINSDAVAQGHFLGQKLNKPDGFEELGLVITKALTNSGSVQLAEVEYGHKHGFMKCFKTGGFSVDSDIKDDMNREYNANILLEKERKKTKDFLATGQEHVVDLYHNFKYKNIYCFIYEYIGTQTLAEYTQFMSVEKKAAVLPTIAIQILKGLAFMHGAGLVHNDIKPWNIIIDTSVPDHHRAVIIDLDFATPLSSGLFGKVKMEVDTLGSLSFRSPECLQGKPCDKRKKDMWGAGATIYWAFYKKLLVEYDSGNSGNEELTSSSVYISYDVSPSMKQYIKQLTALRKIGVKFIKPSTYDPQAAMNMDLLVKLMRAMLEPKSEKRHTPESYLNSIQPSNSNYIYLSNLMLDIFKTQTP